MSTAVQNGTQSPIPRAIALALDDAPTRMFLLTRLVDKIESGDAINELMRAGFDQATIEQLRGMSMSDALRFTSDTCGLSLQVEPGAMQGHLTRLAHAKRLRERLEYFISNGASPRLLMQLFRISPTEARRLRKLLAPATASGGRTRTPTDEEREDIATAWRALQQNRALDDCDRVWMLHQQFNTHWIATLELVIMPPASTVTFLRD